MSRFFDFLGGWMVIPDHYSTRKIEAKYEHFRDHSIEYNRSLKTQQRLLKKKVFVHIPHGMMFLMIRSVPKPHMLFPDANAPRGILKSHRVLTLFAYLSKGHSGKLYQKSYPDEKKKLG